MTSLASPLPRWHALWLIAWQQRREGAEPEPDSPAWLARWSEGGADREQRALLRAQHRLGADAGHLGAALRRACWGLAAVCVLLALGGALGVLSLLGDGHRPVNVVWAWLGLLGPHLLLFALWLASLVAGAGLPFAGRSLLALGQRLPGLLPEAPAMQALWEGLRQHGLARWGLSLLSHLLWLAALGGALIGLLLALSLRRYGFHWETTILPASWFETLVAALAWLPGLLGLPQPDPALVSASGDAAPGEQAARRAWSFWLVGGLLIYGLLPRLAAALFCTWRLRRGLARLRLPWEQPYYALLGRRLAPRSTRLGVVDADPGADRVERWARSEVGEGAALLGIDLPPHEPWPPVASAARDLGRCESREQRTQALDRLAQAPAARLLVVIEAAQSPDRAALRLLGGLSQHARELAVLLAGPDRDQRRGLWKAQLLDRGLPEDRVLEQPAHAEAWLAEGAP